MKRYLFLDLVSFSNHIKFYGCDNRWSLGYQKTNRERRQWAGAMFRPEGGVGPDDLKHKNLITLYNEAFIQFRK